ncbi:MAG: FAD binding domain-containing protein [Hyphomicrobiaceae bacterium]
MKSAPFHYHAPSTVAEAVGLLARYGVDAKVIAGGQSLVPVMAFRLARPGQIIDINGIEALDYVRMENGHLHIGALARHAAFHAPVEPGPLGQLLSIVVQSIAHLPIRTRGTFCGSLAHADASSEWCATAATLDAEIVLESTRGQRVVKAADYFKGFLMTDRGDDELVVEARLPLLPAGTRFGFEEFSRRAGDYALGLCLAIVRLEGGKAVDVRIGIGGAEPFSRRIAEAEAVLAGQPLDKAVCLRAAEAAACAVDPMSDMQADPEYRRDLVRAMVRRALEKCLP